MRFVKSAIQTNVHLRELTKSL